MILSGLVAIVPPFRFTVGLDRFPYRKLTMPAPACICLLPMLLVPLLVPAFRNGSERIT